MKFILASILSLLFSVSSFASVCVPEGRILLGLCQVKDSKDMVEISQWRKASDGQLVFATTYSDHDSCVMKVLDADKKYYEGASFQFSDIKKNDEKVLSLRADEKWAEGNLKIDKATSSGVLSYAYYAIDGGFFTHRGEKLYSFTTQLVGCQAYYSNIGKQSQH